MNRSQYQIQAEVRRVFARHWIDLDRLQLGVYRDMVRVTGELHVTAPASPGGDLSILDVVQGELMRIREIRCVVFDLANWRREDRRWREARSLGLTTASDGGEIDVTQQEHTKTP